MTRAPSVPVNVERALQVEVAVLHIGELHRITIIMVYLWRAPEQVLRRRLQRWRVRDPGPALNKAQRRGAVALQSDAPHVGRIRIA